MDPAPIPRPTANGKVISIARIFVKPGCEERMSEYLTAIRKEAGSEKGTLTYRTTRALGSDGAFVVFEEYTGEEAVKQHYKGKAFTEMATVFGKEDILDTSRGGVELEYYEEF
ncbi:hypothetical protein P7C73_g1319, partial [Tremellales sp. Uapishka_1]